MFEHNNEELSAIVAGPMIRRLTPTQMVVWLVATEPLCGSFEIFHDQVCIASHDLADCATSVRVGQRAYIHLLDCRTEHQPLPRDTWLEYDIKISWGGRAQGLADLLPELLYDGENRPGFVIKTRLDKLLHGSCRKPHFSGPDGLLVVDEVLAKSVGEVGERAALLIMSGDQVYADDVSGPLLIAIHQVIELLGLYPEELTGATVADSRALFQSEFCYYQRESLLPHTEANRDLRDRFFGGTRKPIFTAVTAHNHLITLAEVLAMYFLVWSPTLWARVKFSVHRIPAQHRALFEDELHAIKGFVAGLGRVRRALAHLPVYMIFDDHDVTDDWNLTRGWEESAYQHPFSRRIIGNALIAYWLCQGWGNAPQRFDSAFMDKLRRCLKPGEVEQDALIDDLLKLEHWGFSLPGSPKLVVLDTRTQRWWSESSSGKPSGLMDWEALTELQQELLDESAVVLVSAAPIFGVKFIEIVQRIFTIFGHALTVDAENWMAHPGAANVILNIFRHPRTPQNFVILSGDVHYSFAYDVTIRFRKNSPDIWQITCSGIKNEFPRGLLGFLEPLNRWLYSSRSPLNWLTRRRHMQVEARAPEDGGGRELFNGSGVGQVTLNADGVPTQISVLPAVGGEVKFLRRPE